MKIISAIITALLPLTASAASLIVPAAGTGPGAYNSHWQSELTLHNTSATAVTVGVKFHDRSGAQSGDDIQINARSTVTIQDIVATRFGRDSAIGALELTIDDAVANQPYLGGKSLSLAEIVMATHIYRWFNYAIERPNLRHLRAWYERFCNRPAPS